MRCSILIVNWKSSDLLDQLLESLKQFPESADQEIIVVDNKGGDFDERYFSTKYPEVIFLPQPDNIGYARGNNIAFKQSSGDYLVLLNPDTRVTEGALTALTDFLDKNPKAGIAAPQLIFQDGSVQMSCRSFPWPFALLWEATGISRIFPGNRFFSKYRMRWFDHQKTIQVDQPMATCWAMPRKTADKTGLFDESFPILFNDVDLAWRVKKAGGEVWFVAESKVYHSGGHSTSQLGSEFHKMSHEGLVKFYDKNWKGQVKFLWLGVIISKCNYLLKTTLKSWWHRDS